MTWKRTAASALVVLLTITAFPGNNAAIAHSSQRSGPSRTVQLGTGQIGTARSGATRRRARTYDVLHYVIRTRFDVPNKTLFGEVDVTLKPLSSGFNTFELDAAQMKIDRVSLSNGPVLSSRIQPGTLVIKLDRTYVPSDTITVTVKYHTIPQRGLYFISSSRAHGYQRPQQIWTQGEPEENHFWFPCYDFPDDKATSEQFITTASNDIAIANGTLVETLTNANGTQTFHWRMSQPHSSYLISLVVGDYTKLSDRFEDVLLEYYTYRGTETMALRAFNKTPTMMRWFGERLGVEFPYERYAQTVVGDFIFGGMENITATTFADTEILAEAEAYDTSKLNLVSHELAHSWFGDLVTCKDWSHLWLNEGFATFLEAAFLESQYGRMTYLQEMQKNAAYYFLDENSRKAHPLVNPNYPLSIELFDATTYKKGAFVVHMLRETVGEENFWKTLNLYLNEYKYKNVDSRDLQNIFERVSGQSLEWFFDQWVYNAGFPDLRVQATYSPSNRRLILNVKQTHKTSLLTTGVFRLPMDIEIQTSTGSRTERIEINRRNQDFVFSLDGRPRAVIIDKSASTLKKLTVTQSRSTLGFVIQDGAELLTRNKIEPEKNTAALYLPAMRDHSFPKYQNAPLLESLYVPLFHELTFLNTLR